MSSPSTTHLSINESISIETDSLVCRYRLILRGYENASPALWLPQVVPAFPWVCNLPIILLFHLVKCITCDRPLAGIHSLHLLCKPGMAMGNYFSFLHHLCLTQSYWSEWKTSPLLQWAWFWDLWHQALLGTRTVHPCWNRIFKIEWRDRRASATWTSCRLWKSIGKAPFCIPSAPQIVAEVSEISGWVRNLGSVPMQTKGLVNRWVFAEKEVLLKPTWSGPSECYFLCLLYGF